MAPQLLFIDVSSGETQGCPWVMYHVLISASSAPLSTLTCGPEVRTPSLPSL